MSDTFCPRVARAGFWRPSWSLRLWALPPRWRAAGAGGRRPQAAAHGGGEANLVLPDLGRSRSRASTAARC